MAYAPAHRMHAMDRLSVYAMLARFPVVCFWLTLCTDIAYWRTENLMWHNFSAWLLFAGMVMGGLAALAFIVALFRPDLRYADNIVPYGIIAAIVLIVAFFNNLVHAGDGWTAIVPWGIVLSLVTVILMAVNAFVGRPVFHRPAFGVPVHD